MKLKPALAYLALLGRGWAIALSDEKPSDDTEITERRYDPFDLYDFFIPPWPTAFFDRALFGLDSTRRSSPKYDIVYNPDDVVVTLDIPGFKKDEIEVELKSAGRVLSISGQKESHDDEHTFTSRFRQSFTLDPGVESEKITANLADGILTLTAPRHPALPGNRRIPVTQFDPELLEQMKTESEEVEEGGEATPLAEK